MGFLYIVVKIYIGFDCDIIIMVIATVYIVVIAMAYSLNAVHFI